jgi:hypothetical protein
MTAFSKTIASFFPFELPVEEELPLLELFLSLTTPPEPVISKVSGGRLAAVLLPLATQRSRDIILNRTKQLLLEVDPEISTVLLAETYPLLLSLSSIEYVELYMLETLLKEISRDEPSSSRAAYRTVYEHLSVFSREERAGELLDVFY